MLRTYNFVNQDINTVKTIFLKTIHETYAELTLDNSAQPKKMTVGNLLGKSFGNLFSNNKGKNDFELSGINQFNANNYGSLHIRHARNFGTGEEGLNRLQQFLDSTNNCQTVAAYMDEVIKFYSWDDSNNFNHTLEVAAAKVARIEKVNRTFDELSDKNMFFKTLTLIKPYGYITTEADMGTLILKQVANNIGYAEETLQQSLFRCDPTNYAGDKEIQIKCDQERKIQQDNDSSAAICG